MDSEQPALSQALLKQTFKDALVEAFHEERDFLYEIIADVMQDFALAEAIHEGRESELISRDEIIRVLEDVP